VVERLAPPQPRAVRLLLRLLLAREQRVVGRAAPLALLEEPPLRLARGELGRAPLCFLLFRLAPPPRLLLRLAPPPLGLLRRAPPRLGLGLAPQPLSLPRRTHAHTFTLPNHERSRRTTTATAGGRRKLGARLGRRGRLAPQPFRRLLRFAPQPLRLLCLYEQ